MKVSVRNLGVIREAEIDLKPFTVFIGPNNAGKTWLAHSLAAIFGLHGIVMYERTYFAKKGSASSYTPLEEVAENIYNQDTGVIDLIQFAHEYGECYFNEVATVTPQWLADYLSTDKTTFDRLKIHFDLTETKVPFIERLLTKSIDNSYPGTAGKMAITAHKEAGGRTLNFLAFMQISRERIRDFVAEIVFGELHRALYEETYIIPSERTTLVAYYIRHSSNDEIINLVMQRQKQGHTDIPTPLSHFLGSLLGPFRHTFEERLEEAQEDNATITTYLRLATFLEEHILGGQVDFSISESGRSSKIYFKPVNGTDMELAIASGMVKELAPLVLYLRYIAYPTGLLVIDEPENGLHPEAQAKLTEFLAMLVNAGLPVLITTHSPYIVDHLTNLMKAAESTEPVAIQEKFYLKRKEAFIARNDVSVYLIDQGKAENMLDEDGVVHWNTFGTVSDRVSEIFFEL